MRDFSLREALETDSSTIRQLIHAVGINPTGLDWRRFVLAVNAQGTVIGCGQIKPHGREILELASLAVRSEFRGRGIARAIIEQLLGSSDRPIYLMCRSRLGPLYGKFGFRPIGHDQMPRYFQRISTLAGLSESLMKSGERLLVMKLE